MLKTPLTIKKMLLYMLGTVAITLILFIAIFLHRYIVLQNSFDDARFEHIVTTNFTTLNEELEQAVQNLHRIKGYATILMSKEMSHRASVEFLKRIMSENLQFQANQYNAYIALSPEKARQYFNQEAFYLSVYKENRGSRSGRRKASTHTIAEVRDQPDYLEDAAYQLAQVSEKVQIAPVYLDECYLKKWILTLALGLYSPNGEFQGIVGIEVILDNLFEKIESATIGETGGIFLAERNSGLILTRIDKERRRLLGLDSHLKRMDYNLYKRNTQNAWQKILRQDTQTANIAGINHRAYRISSKKLNSLPWTIVTYQSQNELRKDLHLGLMMFIFIGIVGFTILASMGLVFMHMMTRPMHRLVNIMKRVKSQDVRDIRAPVAGPIETRMLGEIFNEMLDSINQAVSDKDRYANQLQNYNLTLKQEVGKRTSELAEAMKHAKAANQAKSQFLANMSHELRTPMNAILGYTEMIQEDIEEEQECSRCLEELQKIHTASKHLLNIIDDLLDISKIESGRIELHLEQFAVCDVLSELVAVVQPLFEEKCNTLQMACDLNSVGEMYADLTKVKQNLYNLLSNASKFSEEDTICLSVYREITDNREWIIFCIEDHGIGMSEKQINSLFEAFTQADTSFTRKYGGTGLGLTIVKRFCEMMGGSIQVKSELCQGSTFTMRLPTQVEIKPDA